MHLFQAFILGMVEGLTEFLPISSTGHLMLAVKIMGITSTEFVKSFEISIQLGAILAVLVFYWRALILNLEILKRALAAFVPTAVLGFIFYKIIKKILLGSTGIVLWSLFLGGIFMVVYDFFYRKKKETPQDLEAISYRQAILIGIFQSLAMIPGVSRSAATIYAGLLLGLPRKTAVEFSFLLAVPTLLAAAALDLIKSRGIFQSGDFGILLAGFLTSFAVALASVKFLLYLARTRHFIYFGIYRILLPLAFWLA